MTILTDAELGEIRERDERHDPKKLQKRLLKDSGADDRRALLAHIDAVKGWGGGLSDDERADGPPSEYDKLAKAREWIPWKEGDPLPTNGRYWTTRLYDGIGKGSVMESELDSTYVRGWWPTQYRWKVIAYCPCTKPEPYKPGELA